MSHDDSHHHEVVPNPDYDGPQQHCLPPEVKNSVGFAIVFAILMVALAAGGWALGRHLLG